MAADIDVDGCCGSVSVTGGNVSVDDSEGGLALRRFSQYSAPPKPNAKVVPTTTFRVSTCEGRKDLSRDH